MDTRHKLKIGSIVQYMQNIYYILELTSLTKVFAREQKTGTTSMLPVSALRPVIEFDNKAVDLVSLTKEQWAHIDRCLEIVKPFIGVRKHRRGKGAVQKQADAYGVSYSTVNRLINKYEKTRSVTAFLPSYGKNQPKRLSPEIEKIIEDAMEERYETEERRTVADLYEDIRFRCREKKLKPPHQNTIYNRVKERKEKFPGEVTEARDGEKAAERAARIIEDVYFGADYPNALFQIDHMDCPVELVDDLERLPLGKVWATLSIDVNSRACTFAYPSLETPNENSVGMCIAGSVLDKTDFLADAGIDQGFLDELNEEFPDLGIDSVTDLHPFLGFPDRWQADNAREFRGALITQAVKAHDATSDFEWRLVGKPEDGAHIERLAGSLGQRIRTLPGTTFTGPEEKGDYNSEKNAVMTVSEFRRWLIVEIIRYNHRFHEGISTTPIAKYQEGTVGPASALTRGLPQPIAYPEKLRIDFLPLYMSGDDVGLTIQSYGFKWDHIKYSRSKVLKKHKHKRDPDNPGRKKRFTVRRDPWDISKLYFWDEDLNQYFEIPYRNPEFPSITLWEYKRLRRELRRLGYEKVNEDLLFALCRKNRKAEKEAVSNTKKARRDRQTRSEAEKRKSARAKKDKAIKAAKSSDGEGKMTTTQTPEVESALTTDDIFDDIDEY